MSCDGRGGCGRDCPGRPHGVAPVRVQTETNTVYEVDLQRRRVRLAHGHSRRIGGEWSPFADMTPLTLGEPVIFRWPDGTWSRTTPVFATIEPDVKH